MEKFYELPKEDDLRTFYCLSCKVTFSRRDWVEGYIRCACDKGEPEGAYVLYEDSKKLKALEDEFLQLIMQKEDILSKIESKMKEIKECEVVTTSDECIKQKINKIYKRDIFDERTYNATFTDSDIKYILENHSFSDVRDDDIKKYNTKEDFLKEVLNGNRYLRHKKKVILHLVLIKNYTPDDVDKKFGWNGYAKTWFERIYNALFGRYYKSRRKIPKSLLRTTAIFLRRL